MNRDMIKRDRIKSIHHIPSCPRRGGALRRGGGRRITIHALVIALAAALGGCGVETATTAATGASIKKQEVEEGKRTQERSRQKIEQMQDQMRERAQQAAGDEK